MTVDVGNTAKLNDFRREAGRLGVTVLPPSINMSDVEFTIDEDNCIHYALTAVRNVGRQAIEHIVEVRGDKPFTSMTDFARRISPRYVNKRALESLAAAGAFDCIEPNRARAFACAEAVLAIASRSEEGRIGGQNDLFGEAREDDLPHAGLEDWLPAERLSREYDAIGSFLTGHPIDTYEAVLKRQATTSVREFEAGAQRGTAAARIAGIIVSKQIRRTRTGNKLAVLGLSDPSGQVECVVFSESLAAWTHLTEIGTAVIANVVVDRAGEMPRFRIQDLRSLDEIAARMTHTLHVHITDPGAVQSIRNRLSERGEGEVNFFLHDGKDREIHIRLPQRYAVTPQLAAAIKAIPGVDEAIYH